MNRWHIKWKRTKWPIKKCIKFAGYKKNADRTKKCQGLKEKAKR